MEKTKKIQKIKKTKKFAPSIPYEEWLMEQLKDHELAVAYLNNALEESKKAWAPKPLFRCGPLAKTDWRRRRDKESLELLLVAFRNVIKARGGITKIAQKTGLGRESLYKTVSPSGNPAFRTVATLSHALGLELRFT